MSLLNAKEMLRATSYCVPPEPCERCCGAILARSQRGIFSAYVPHHQGGTSGEWDRCQASLSMLGYYIDNPPEGLRVSWGGCIL